MIDGAISTPAHRIAANLGMAMYYQQLGDIVRVMSCALDAFRAAREIGDVEAGRCSLLLLREAEALLAPKERVTRDL